MKNSTIYTVLLTLIITIGLFSCGSGNSPSSTVLKSFDLMKSKDYEKIAAMYVNKDGEKLSEEEAKKIEGLIGMGAKEHEKEGGIDNVTIDEETISEDGKEATVDFTIHYKNGETDKDDADLINVDGKWYMVLNMN